MVCQEKKTGWLMGCGAVTVVLGAILVVFWPALFMSQLRRMMILSPTSTSFGIWKEIPIPMYLECFMFNLTNVDDILAGKNVTLRVEQLGPYVYRETHTKVNLSWNANGTVTFYNRRYWHFMPEMSNGSLSDEIVSINPVIATVGYLLRYNSFAIKAGANAFMRAIHSNMFLRANVSSWLFDGIEDRVLDIAMHIPNLPFIIPYDKFGWFYERNGSLEFDGSFNMNTGANDFSSLGNVERWRFSNRTMYRDECGVVKGSTGELWAPEFGQPEVVIFASDICTYIILGKDEDVTVQGIDGVQYAANDSVFDNGHNFPRTACYCDEVRDRDCVPSGALNVSECRFGAPAFVSLPHFLHSDPYYPSKIDGLNATEAMRFRLSLEMYTGMPLAVAAQLQINLLVRHVSFIPINNVLPDPDTMVPMFWFRQELKITPEYADMAKSALRLRYWVPYGLYALTVIGVSLLIAGITLLIKRLLKSPETTPILQEQGSSSSSSQDEQ